MDLWSMKLFFIFLLSESCYGAFYIMTPMKIYDMCTVELGGWYILCLFFWCWNLLATKNEDWKQNTFDVHWLWIVQYKTCLCKCFGTRSYTLEDSFRETVVCHVNQVLCFEAIFLCLCYIEWSILLKKKLDQTQFTRFLLRILVSNKFKLFWSCQESVFCRFYFSLFIFLHFSNVTLCIQFSYFFRRVILFLMILYVTKSQII